MNHYTTARLIAAQEQERSRFGDAERRLHHMNNVLDGHRQILSNQETSIARAAHGIDRLKEDVDALKEDLHALTKATEEHRQMLDDIMLGHQGEMELRATIEKRTMARLKRLEATLYPEEADK